MHENIKIEPGQYGLKATLLSGWSSEVCEYLLDTEIAELELNQGKGWRGDDIEFIGKFKSLKAFRILDLSIRDISPVHFLKDIIDLTLVTYSKTKLDFSQFSDLKKCDFIWNNNCDSIFGCDKIEILCIDGYKGKDLKPFGRLNRVKELIIVNNSSIANLIGISDLIHLQYLRLGNYKKLNSLGRRLITL